MGRGVGNRRPARDLGNGLAGQGEHSGLTGILIAGDQNRFGLLLQSSDRDLLQAPVPGGLNGGVQTAQVHVGGNHQGPPLIDGVPGRDVRGRRLVFLLQCGLSQPGAVVRLSHDLKLHRSGVVAGEEMNREPETLVRSPIRD